ncbi:MAG: DegT/DnrJ/EryC1/StrS family aminotransferase [Undibacterium sp.]|nr:DegT/DnrJ/EryC1/StrS family aminotransferase [Opitutaceae bacterium]
MTRKIPFYHHDLGQAEIDAFTAVVRGPILTTGDVVLEFERRFSAYLGVAHTVGVTSWTGGAHIALVELGIGPGDEVITTPLTFIASATAIIQAGATPVFVDVEPQTGNLDARLVEAAITPRTKAILPVHLYGQMCDMRALRAIADRQKLAIIEDCAHCVEGERDGVRPGLLSEAACFSFFATKNLTCGEGGAIVTRDAARARQLRLLRLHGMDKTAADRARDGYQHWDMVTMGWKYNMDNLQAALLLPQFDRLETKARRREALAQLYLNELAGIAGLSSPLRLPGVRHANHLFTVWIGEGRRDSVIAGLQQRGISCVVNYRAIHLLTYFRDRFGFRPGAFPQAERIGDETISLPFYPTMADADVVAVANALREILA